MIQVFLLLGGNLGNRFKSIKLAKEKIKEKIGEINKESSLYETEAWGFKSEQSFLNQVVVINTTEPPQKVLKYCLEIEDELGRERKSEHYESRTMDIDILFYNAEIIQEDNLVVPHPKLHQRRFTLEPLVEIEPDFVHPILNKKLKMLLHECTDDSKVIRLNK